MSAAAPTISDALLRQFAGELTGSSTSKVAAIRGNPQANYGDVELADGTIVAVRPCVSALAIRDALTSLGPDEYLIVVTDRPNEDLGDTLLARFRGQRVVPADSWRSVERLFRARTTARDLRGGGPAIADALLRYAPASGYLPAPLGVLTYEHAMRPLAAAVLGIDDAQLNPVGLMWWTCDLKLRDRWRQQDESVRSAIARWAESELGIVARTALAVGTAGGAIDAISVGLAVDVMWPSTGVADSTVVAARTRLEMLMGNEQLNQSSARQLADAARGIVLRLGVGGDTGRSDFNARSEALIADLQWPEGSGYSSVLPAGYDYRLRQLAAGIDASLAANSSVELERLLGDLLRHESAALDREHDTRCAQMAVRLARWLAVPEAPAPATLAEALQRQTNVDGWVDRAVADVIAGSADEQVAASYAKLCAEVARRRSVHDLQFAALLADATERETNAGGVLLIEDLVAKIVLPLGRVLMIVVDGMSTAVATELADGAAARDWRELLPAGDDERQCALAVLPTLTMYSRTSLFAGQLRVGGQADEKQLFPALGGAVVFHKEDLRTPAGSTIAPPVSEAIRRPGNNVVAVVLNTVDDTLAKHDPDGTEWTVDAVQHLSTLLDAAAANDRVVVLTSDHGHVVERGGQTRMIDGAGSRCRSTASGPATADEVLVAGRRVLAGDGAMILPAIETLRYAKKRAGYHGGATPAEATVPVVVLTREPDNMPANWNLAGPVAPAWWYEPVPALSAVRGTTAAYSVVESADDEIETLFSVVASESVAAPVPQGRAVPAVVVELFASDIYQRQLAAAGRAALAPTALENVLATLLAGGGRADSAAVAAAAGIPTVRFRQTLTVLRRTLNVEGYDVVRMDADQRTVVLDEALLRAQFKLGVKA